MIVLGASGKPYSIFSVILLTNLESLMFSDPEQETAVLCSDLCAACSRLMRLQCVTAGLGFGFGTRAAVCSVLGFTGHTADL